MTEDIQVNNRRAWTPQEDHALLQFFDQKRESTTLTVRQIAGHYAHVNPDRTYSAYMNRYARLKRHPEEQPLQETRAYLALQTLIEEYTIMQRRIQELEKRVEELEPMEEEYNRLCLIIEGARKAAFKQEEATPKFKMDQNGNLERV